MQTVRQGLPVVWRDRRLQRAMQGVQCPSECVAPRLVCAGEDGVRWLLTWKNLCFLNLLGAIVNLIAVLGGAGMTAYTFTVIGGLVACRCAFQWGRLGPAA